MALLVPERRRRSPYHGLPFQVSARLYGSVAPDAEVTPRSASAERCGKGGQQRAPFCVSDMQAGQRSSPGFESPALQQTTDPLHTRTVTDKTRVEARLVVAVEEGKRKPFSAQSDQGFCGLMFMRTRASLSALLKTDTGCVLKGSDRGARLHITQQILTHPRLHASAFPPLPRRGDADCPVNCCSPPRLLVTAWTRIPESS
ncbi:unnamed protein product [Pleuronectes platessa]|uniref:Uncharacterized protein n=1 Tax=Pleuronectes platessa TaxID=8262 RepID=A0A9N7U8T4_PLEPL|nr:unnamed protein product [Pleuronectes platessa]